LRQDTIGSSRPPPGHREWLRAAGLRAASDFYVAAAAVRSAFRRRVSARTSRRLTPARDARAAEGARSAEGLNAETRVMDGMLQFDNDSLMSPARTGVMLFPEMPRELRSWPA
jgi:hypothetical protein